MWELVQGYLLPQLLMLKEVIWVSIFLLLFFIGNYYNFYFQLSSSNHVLWYYGIRRDPLLMGRDARTGGNDCDPFRSRAAAAIRCTMQRFSRGQKSSPVVESSDAKQQSFGRIIIIKDHDSALKGIERLHFDNERVHYIILWSLH